MVFSKPSEDSFKHVPRSDSAVGFRMTRGGIRSFAAMGLTAGVAAAMGDKP